MVARFKAKIDVPIKLTLIRQNREKGRTNRNLYRYEKNITKKVANPLIRFKKTGLALQSAIMYLTLIKLLDRLISIQKNSNLL